jgi:hypothetical protein
MNWLGMGFFSFLARLRGCLLYYAFSLSSFIESLQAQKKNPVNIGFYANEF